MMLNSLQMQLCDIQGRLFELSGREKCDSETFVEHFMTGSTATHFDRPYDRSQWMGEEYLFEEIDESAGGLPREGIVFDNETLYWMGYTYRYWHYYTNESSRDIYRIADAETMRRTYSAYHTLDVEAAIDRLKEAHGNREG